jgi:uncharacterized protein YndB with AHSA1/START domain
VVSNRDIRLQRLIDAPIEVTSDLRVGGVWSVRFGPSPDEMYAVDGVYKVVDPPRRLVYSSVFRYPDGRSFETLTTVTFEARLGQTLLTFVDAGFPTGEDLGMFETGTVAVLDTFKRVVEASAA